MVKVSIIIPVYNAQKFLPQCLDSLISQDFDSFEIVCVNDGSNDGSSEILAEYGRKYKKIKVVENEKNRGLSFTRNKGISLAEGEFLLFVDSDDWLMSNNVLSLLYNTVNKRDLDLLRFNLSTDEFVVTDYACYEEGKDLFVHLLNSNLYKWESVRNFVSRKKLIDKNILFDEEIYGCEDILFSTKCIWQIEKVAEIPDKLYFYNRHDCSITRSSISSKNIEGLLRVIDAIYTIFGESICDRRRYSLIMLANQLIRMCESLLYKLDSSLDFSGWTQNTMELYEHYFKEGRLIHNHQLYTNIDAIRQAEIIYLYGAGEAAEELLYKTKHVISYSGIIVTQKKNEEKTFGKLEIYEVSDKRLNKSGLVMVCITGKERQKEVKKTLENHKFKNVLIIARE